MKNTRKPRIEKKLNKKARDFLIESNQFQEDDFEEDGSILYIRFQTENCDECEECPPYKFIEHTAHVLATNYDYDEETDALHEYAAFKVRNPKHVFDLNRESVKKEDEDEKKPFS